MDLDGDGRSGRERVAAPSATSASREREGEGGFRRLFYEKVLAFVRNLEKVPGCGEI